MTPEQTWQAVLGELQLQMTQPTYDTWLRPTKFNSLDAGIYTIFADSSYIKEWLDTKLHSTIKRTLSGITGEPTDFKVIVVEKPKAHGEESDTPADPDTLEIIPHYGDLQNTLVQPDKPAWMTRYFWIRWGAILGNDRLAVVMALRLQCYWNPRTGELRDICEIHQADLARLAHLSLRKLQRILSDYRENKDDPLHNFIRDITHQYINSAGGEIRRKVTRYQVRMDDPLTTEDDAFVEEIGTLSENDQELALAEWERQNLP